MSAGTDAAARRRVVEASAALAAAGQQDMVWGHVAVRDPDGRGVWMKRSGIGFDEVGHDDVHLVDWSGALLEGVGKPHIESHIHLQIQRARPDVAASVHSHPVVVNAFSSLGVPLLALSHEGALFADPQVPRFEHTGDLVATPELGALLAVELGDAPACLMLRHGLVAVGSTEAEAVMRAVLLTAACDVQLRAAAAGSPSGSDAEEIAAKREHCWPASQIDAGYAYLIRASARSTRQPRD
ncbi:MAG: class II aldolase/adducin family protein [Microbacterium sp.]